MVLTTAKPEILNQGSATAKNLAESQVQNPSKTRATSFQQSYHEMANEHSVEVDVLVQLRSNMAQLEDLHGRLRHMMGELSYLLKRD